TPPTEIDTKGSRRLDLPLGVTPSLPLTSTTTLDPVFRRIDHRGIARKVPNASLDSHQSSLPSTHKKKTTLCLRLAKYTEKTSDKYVKKGWLKDFFGGLKEK
uniref:Uncharacterized protein n=1 Tax=Cucumis melo TaxID=3656 RepID=A0A9I9EAG9_CUCME